MNPGPEPFSLAGKASQDYTVIDSVHRYNKKMQSLTADYNLMLSQTLDSQRVYFERRLQGLDIEERELVELRKREVKDMEARLEEIDLRVGAVIRERDAARGDYEAKRLDYAQVLKQLCEVELENRRLREINQQREVTEEEKVENLKREIEALEREVAEVKLERADMLQHVKMQEKIKKSGKAAEIARGPTLIFETGK
jgi:hypothetical protein